MIKTIKREDRLYQEQFESDQLRNERFRFLILLIILSVMFVFVIILSITYDRELRTLFNQRPTFDWLLVLIGLLIVRSLGLQYYLKHRIKTNRPFYPFQRYINAFVEVSVPSIAIIIFSQNMQPMHALITPASFFYFVFILITALEMDWRLSVFTGAVAGFEYLFLAMYFLNTLENPTVVSTLYLPAPYFAKAGLLVACGIISGLITRHLKQRVIEGYHLQAERNRIENLFGQQVSVEIVDELMDQEGGLESQQRFVCILFLDVRGFTQFCQNRSPEEIVQYQNDLFSFMIDIIISKKGIINQFLGDGFMATFGAPVSTGNDVQNAVDAALQIIDEVEKRSQTSQIVSTKIGIGIDAGDAVTGNVGTTTRQQYSVTGNVVIRAARLEQLNKKLNSHILISREVLNHLKINSVDYLAMGREQLKGIVEPVEIFRLA